MSEKSETMEAFRGRSARPCRPESDRVDLYESETKKSRTDVKQVRTSQFDHRFVVGEYVHDRPGKSYRQNAEDYGPQDTGFQAESHDFLDTFVIFRAVELGDED
jgi:hypothetical protein